MRFRRQGLVRVDYEFKSLDASDAWWHADGSEWWYKVGVTSQQQSIELIGCQPSVVGVGRNTW